MTEAIRVAEILNDRELALTGGASNGLAVGDVLRIVTQQATQIRDPETGEPLGEIVRTKAIVRVYEVQERFALARTFRTRRVNVGGQGTSSFAGIFEAPKYETRVETLRRDPSGERALDEAESVVAVGDVAEIVEGKADDIPTSTVWR